jgi:hypothetical protein
MIFDYQAQTVENVYHVKNGLPFAVADLQTIASEFKQWWATSLRSSVSSQLTLAKIEVVATDSQTAPAIVYTTDLPLSGTAATFGPMPNNVTVAMKWSTGLRGRSYRGRTYHLGLCEDQVVGNEVNGTFLAGLIASYADLLGHVNIGANTLCVVSRFHNNSARVSGVATDILSVSADPVIDSQRRRLPGRGR